MKKQCVYCEELFLPHHKLQKYCTEQCREKKALKDVNAKWASKEYEAPKQKPPGLKDKIAMASHRKPYTGNLPKVFRG